MIYDARRNVVAFVDFDNCCRDHPAHDVARGLVHFGCFPAAPAMNRFQGLPSRFRDDLGVGFLAGYQRTAPDGQDVAAVLPYVAGCIAVELCVLALLNGWFGTDEMSRMADLPRSVADWVHDILPKAWNHG
jgi:Ser/Thr protein kinase RdoA (MazF antagonist)